MPQASPQKIINTLVLLHSIFMTETCVFLNNNDGLLLPHYHYRYLLSCNCFSFNSQKTFFRILCLYSYASQHWEKAGDSQWRLWTQGTMLGDWISNCRSFNRPAWPVAVPGPPLATGLAGGTAACLAFCSGVWWQGTFTGHVLPVGWGQQSLAHVCALTETHASTKNWKTRFY